MPSQAAEKTARRAEKKASEFNERWKKNTSIPEAYNQAKITYDEYSLIFHEALKACNATEILEEEGGSLVTFVLPGMDQDATLRGYLPALYEKAKFCPREACLEAQIEKLQEYVQFATPEIEKSSSPPDTLHLTVKTLEFVLKMDQSLQNPGLPEELSGVLYRPFSKDSGELFVAAVLGSDIADNWIGHSYLSQWNISEDELFVLGVQNIDKITPKKLNCRQVRNPEDMPKFFSQKRSRLIPILHYENKGSSGLLWVSFEDQRALPRLLLPRVIERFAEILKCDSTSLVVIPFDHGGMHVGNAEDRLGMLNLSVIQKLPQLQGDPHREKFRVTWNPFTVRGSCTFLLAICVPMSEIRGLQTSLRFNIPGMYQICYHLRSSLQAIKAVIGSISNPAC